MAYVQSANARATGSATTIAGTYAGAVAAGNLLWAGATWGDGTGSATFSDSVNGAWTATVLTVNDGSNGQSISLAYRLSTAAGTPTVTATVPNSAWRGIIVTEEDGVGAQDVSAGQTTAATTSPSSGSTAAVTTPFSVAFGFICNSGGQTAAISSADVAINGGTGGQNPAPDLPGGLPDIAAGNRYFKGGAATTSVTFLTNTSAVSMVAAMIFGASEALRRVGGSSRGPKWWPSDSGLEMLD